MTNQATTAEPTQIFHARLAGFVYLLLIVLYMSGQFLISRIVEGSDFAAAAQNVVSSERLYRIALILQLITTVSTVVLAYALYITVRPVNERLAQMAMFWRFGESFIGAVVVIFSFVKLRIYTAAGAAGSLELDQWQALMTLTRSAGSAGFNVSTLFFSVGSVVFFCLFLKSSYIPKAQSILGIAASILVIFTSLANLAIPEHGDIIQFGWVPMAASEIITGFWLLFLGIKVRSA